MDIKIDRDDLFPLIGQVQGILERKKITPIHSCFLLEADIAKGKKKGSLKVFASGWELGFQAELSCAVSKKGRVVVNGKSFFDILREIPPGRFHLTEGENRKVTVEAKDSVFHIFGLDPEDFPTFEPVESSSFQKVPVKEFLDVIDKTVFCVSLDDSRYHLTGVFCERIKDSFTYRFAATDGYRMAFCDLDLGEKGFVPFGDNIIIPRKGLQEVKKMIIPKDDEDEEKDGGEFDFAVEKSRAVIKHKNQTLSIRLIDGEFPPYQALIPKKDKGMEATLDKGEFETALRRIAVLTTDRFKAVNFLFKNQKLTLKADTPELGHGTSVLPCRHKKGKFMKIRFNCRYIMDVVQVLKEEEADVFVRDASSGIIIKGKGNKNYTAVVMPMTLRDQTIDEDDVPEKEEEGGEGSNETGNGEPC